MAYRKDATMKTTHLEQEEVTQTTPGSAAKLIREVKQKTRKRLSSEDKIRIVLEGFRRELPVSDLCRKENISTPIYYSWLKDFMEAGKSRLKGDGLRDATKSEVRSLRDENNDLKELVGSQALEIQLLKKSLNA
jgi:transposase